MLVIEDGETGGMAEADQTELGRAPWRGGVSRLILRCKSPELSSAMGSVSRSG